MPATAQTLVDEIRTMHDVDQAAALSALDRKHKRMVAQSRCYRKRLSAGTTVAGQAEYPLDVIELYSLEVAGVPYGKARRPDLYGYSQGALIWVGPGGLIVADADTSGVRGISLIPTPTSTGDAITAFAAVKAPDLTLTSALLVDEDFLDALVEGTGATFLRRLDENRAAADGEDQRFEAECERLRRRVLRRFRGPGPAQIRVQGVNA